MTTENEARLLKERDEMLCTATTRLDEIHRLRLIIRERDAEITMLKRRVLDVTYLSELDRLGALAEERGCSNSDRYEEDD